MDDIEARWVLGLLDEEDIVAFATNALVAGSDDDLLVTIAGATPAEIGSVRDLFANYLLKQQRGEMATSEALAIYTRSVCQQIIVGDVPPIEGARYIWRASSNLGDEEASTVDGFIYAASEAENRPNEKRFFEKIVLQEARRVSDGQRD